MVEQYITILSTSVDVLVV